MLEKNFKIEAAEDMVNATLEATERAKTVLKAA